MYFGSSLFLSYLFTCSFLLVHFIFFSELEESKNEMFFVVVGKGVPACINLILGIIRVN